MKLGAYGISLRSDKWWLAIERSNRRTLLESDLDPLCRVRLASGRMGG